MDLPAWLDRASPSRLGAYLGTTASPRKGGLFLRDVCRSLAGQLFDPRGRAALDAADRFEAGEIDPDEFQAAVARAEAANEEVRLTLANYADLVAQTASSAASLALEAAARGYYPHALDALRRLAGWSNSRLSRRRKSTARTLRLAFYEHFGDTESPVAPDPSWRTEAVVALATGVYSDCAFERLPVLADALEDAGCANADVLAHCRGRGPHVRGCWVVDLVLGKA